jgi:hypothetical protein
MTKLLATLSVCFMVGTTCLAQKPTPAAQPTMPYGKIDQADLELKACDFEKDANAMVLFDKGDVYYDQDFAITMERHKRIKIFNDNGKSEANIRIEYYGGNRLENITGLQAETINLVNGKPEITKLDSKLLYSEVIDKVRSAYVFSFPNVKPGSIIEYKYKLNTPDYSNLPDWTFQSKLPVKYSGLIPLFPIYCTSPRKATSGSRWRWIKPRPSQKASARVPIWLPTRLILRNGQWPTYTRCPMNPI